MKKSKRMNMLVKTLIPASYLSKWLDETDQISANAILRSLKCRILRQVSLLGD